MGHAESDDLGHEAQIDAVLTGEVIAVSSAAKHAGSRYRFKRKLPGGIVEGQFPLTDYVLNQSILMQCDWVGPLKPAGGYTLEAVPEGTRISMVERVEARGPLKLLRPLLSLMFRNAGNIVLRNLKHLVEQQANVHRKA